MDIKILSPLWGYECLEYKTFLEKVKKAGYDGYDLWLPDCKKDRHLLYNFLQKHEMTLVTHQHAANGRTFNEFKASYVRELLACAEPGPLLINSHTGRDYFPLEQHIVLVDIAEEISAKTGVVIVHETHRGRLGYSPQMMQTIFNLRKQVKITADFSHWTCVTESMLQYFENTVKEAIRRTRHVHARIGYEQGPQVPDPRAAKYQYALNHFLYWWDQIVETNKEIGTKLLSFTTEFGPFPYMPADPVTSEPLADQFELNCFMKNLLDSRYKRTNGSQFGML
ncbi:TIM barrel protein [Olivibacter sp. CPCC 100613]|uniref:sugar phosphate isomerase/epimerase family protein n=1 Tax=Olivibacter sp. CPCC 100613 TaxID=3079931 RepID=UPI002FF47088